MGAGEADGGRRGRWGQARPMGAASHRPHARVHQHRRLRKPPGQIPSQQDHIVDLLDDEEKSFRYLSNNSVKRSFVDVRRATVEAVAALKATIIKGSIPRDLTDAGIRTCYENGWLHSEPLDRDAANLICVYPTRLHLK